MSLFDRLFNRNKSTSPLIEKSVLDKPSFSCASPSSDFFDSLTSRLSTLDPIETYNKIAPVRNAISKIADSAARAKIRLFTSDDQEITGGSLFNLLKSPNKFQSQYQFSQELISWYLLTSEFTVFLGNDNIFVKPTTLMPWNPLYLHMQDPANPNTLEDLKLWRYQYSSGAQVVAPVATVIYGKSFSAGYLRGTSSLISGTNEINTYYQTMRYTRSYYENDGVPSTHVKIPKGLGEDAKKRFVEEWYNVFGTDKNGSFKTFFSDNDTEIVPIESKSIKDQFADNIIKTTKGMIYEMFSVPPIISGDWANAKYDSADAQLEAYAENVLFPILQNLTDTFQSQLVNQYSLIWNKDIQIAKSTNLSKSVKKSLEKAKQNNPTERIFIIWDTDSLPIAAKLHEKRIASAINLMTAGRVSAGDAYEFYGIDLPENIATDKVYVSTTLQEVTETPVQIVSQPNSNQDSTSQQDPASQSDQPQDPTYQDTQKTVLSEESKAVYKKLSRFFLEYRKYAISQVIDNKSLKLRDLDAILDKSFPGDNPVKVETRLLFAQINQSFKSCENTIDKQAAIKKLFSQIPNERVRCLTNEYIESGVLNETKS